MDTSPETTTPWESFSFNPSVSWNKYKWKWKNFFSEKKKKKGNKAAMIKSLIKYMQPPLPGLVWLQLKQALKWKVRQVRVWFLPPHVPFPTACFLMALCAVNRTDWRGFHIQRQGLWQQLQTVVWLGTGPGCTSPHAECGSCVLCHAGSNPHHRQPAPGHLLRLVPGLPCFLSTSSGFPPAAKGVQEVNKTVSWSFPYQWDADQRSALHGLHIDPEALHLPSCNTLSEVLMNCVSVH